MAPSNLWFYTIFQNCTISVQGNVISDSNNLYGYRGVIPLVLTSGEGEKTSTLTSKLFYKDTFVDSFTSGNKGFESRQAFATASRTFDVIGRISASLFEQDRWIPNGVSIDIKLTRSSPSFCIDSAVVVKPGETSVPYKYSIEEATLLVKAHTINPDILRLHQQLFKKEKAVFPLNEYDVRSAQIPIGALTFVSENLFPSKVPGYLIIGLVAATSFTGALNKSPFNFAHYDVSSVTVKCDENVLLFREVKVDFDSNLFQIAYINLASALGRRSTGNFIDRNEFKQRGYCLYLFELLPSVNPAQFQIERKGLLKVIKNPKGLITIHMNLYFIKLCKLLFTQVEISFRKSTTQSLNLIALGTFTNLLSIDEYRNTFLS